MLKMEHYVCVNTGYPCNKKRLDANGISKIIDLINKDILVYGASYMRKDRESDMLTLINHFGDYYEDSEKMYKNCFKHNQSLKNCECEDSEECHGMGCKRHCMCLLSSLENHCDDTDCNEHNHLSYINKYYVGQSNGKKDKWPKSCLSEGIRYNEDPVFVLKDGMKIYDIVKICKDLYYCNIWSDWVSDMKIHEYNIKCNGREIKFTIIKVDAESG